MVFPGGRVFSYERGTPVPRQNGSDNARFLTPQLLFFFITLGLELSDTKVYEHETLNPQR